MADNLITQTISTTDAAVVVGCADNPLVSIEVSGTWAGTLNVETNLDPNNAIWRTGKVFTEANVTASASISANGRWIIQAAGVGQVRARLNPATSGAAVVTLRAGDNETFGLSGGGGGGGGGAVTVTNPADFVDGWDATQGLTTSTGIITDINGTAQGFRRGNIKMWLNFLARLPAALVSGRLDVNVGAGTVTGNQGTPNAGGVNAWPVTLASTLSEANDSVTGHIGGYTKTVDLTLTRPANVTPYTAGDEISDTTGTAGQRTLAGCGRVNGGSGTLDGLALIFSENPVITPTLEVYVFDAIPATAGDNAAFAPTDAELNAALGVVTLSTGKVGTTGTGGNIMWDSGPVAIDFVCAGGSTSLFFLLVTRTAFTPTVNSSTMKLRVRVTQN